MAMQLLAGASLNNQRITNLGDGTAATDAVTLQQLQAYVRGLSWKESVTAASTGDVSLSAPGTGLDGISLTSGDRILLKDQTTPSQNGIYIWTGTSSTLTRALDADASDEIQGAAVFVERGTVNGDKMFVLTTDAITLGTTSLVFTQFGGGTTYAAGNGLTLAGTTFSVTANTGISVSSSGVAIDTSVVPRIYRATLSGTVTHNLNTYTPMWFVQHTSTRLQVFMDIAAENLNSLTVTTPSGVTLSDYNITVIG